MHDEALVLIDMQRCMADPDGSPRNNPGAEANLARLLAAWRGSRLPVIHVRHLSLDPTSGFYPGQSGAAFQEPFGPQEGEAVADKHVTDAFAGSGLERHLHLRSIRRLVVAGVSTNYSVEATVRSAGSLGFSAIVVADACFTFDGPDLRGGSRAAEEIHWASLNNLSGEYASVQTTDEIFEARPGLLRKAA